MARQLLTPEFIDAQTMAKKYPDTFEAPTEVELSSIKVGNSIKVCAGRERFWVTVTSVDGNILTGAIDNDLLHEHEHGLKDGDWVTFEKRHVYGVLV